MHWFSIAVAKRKSWGNQRMWPPNICVFRSSFWHYPAMSSAPFAGKSSIFSPGLSPSNIFMQLSSNGKYPKKKIHRISGFSEGVSIQKSIPLLKNSPFQQKPHVVCRFPGLQEVVRCARGHGHAEGRPGEFCQICQMLGPKNWWFAIHRAWFLCFNWG